MDSMFHLWRISLARSMIISACFADVFDFVEGNFGSAGPTRLMLSTLAMRAVETRSRLVGMVMAPVVRSFLECRSISILPMRPVFWSSRRSSYWSQESLCLAKNCA